MVASTALNTKNEQIREIIKCGKDPVYFIKNYVKIQHPTQGTIPFETYGFQDDCINAFLEHRLNIILKSRQLGLSTICAAYATWMAIFQKDKNILVIATKLSVAINFIKKVTVMLGNIPKWLLLPKYEPSKQQVTFSNGSVIKASPTSEDAGRSEALSLLVIDEAAWIQNFDSIWAGLSPTFSTGGRAIILSTPNGVGGQYYNLWTQAEAGVNGFNPIRIMWHQHPDHDQEWFDKETRNLPRKKISQEYLCVAGDSRIISPDGYIFAKDIKIGDKVLTHKGRFKNVLSVSSRKINKDENLYSVISPGNRKNAVMITGNHPVLSYRFWVNNESYLDKIVKIQNEINPSWIDIDNCYKKRKTTDRIVHAIFPIFDKENITNDIKKIDLSTLYPSQNITDYSCRYVKQQGFTKRFVNIDFDAGKFIGLYLAEGCNCRGGIDLGFHIDEYETHARWVVNFLENLNCRTTLLASTVHNSCRLWTHNKYIGKFVREFVLGTQANNKVLNMDLVLKCGREFIKGLLYGHHLGDGNHKHDEKTSTYSTSSKLIYQLRTLNSFFNLYPRIGRVEHSKKNIKHSDMWNLEFQAKGLTYLELLDAGQQIKKGSRTRLINDYFVGSHQITKLDDNYKNELEVYDIKVEDDSSFVCESMILHNCDFISSGDTFLQANDLDELRTMIQQPLEKVGEKFNIWIWSQPIPGRQYVISADVARGDARDFSAFHVIDVEDKEVAAEYMGKIAPEQLADLLSEWGKKYNTALIVPEVNTFGYAVNTKLRDTGYKRLYYPKHRGDPFSYIPLDLTELPGFPTNQKSRVQILTKLEELIRNKQLRVYSQRLYDQLQAFIWNGNKPMASKDSFDDLIMSLAIGCWLIEGESTNNQSGLEMAYAMLGATGIEQRPAASGFEKIQSTQPLVNPNVIGMNPQNVHKPRDASQIKGRDGSDFSWLYK